jgi:hypothetical protein
LHAGYCLLEKRPRLIAANRANYCSQIGLTEIVNDIPPRFGL